jgi:RNA polymerase sigma factor (sigma-70 family)
MADDKPTSILNHLRRACALPVAPGIGDAELLDRFVRRRDEAAFELLVWRHERMVWGLCRRLLRDRGDAEDAFQAAFFVLARKAGSIGRRESVACWLYRVTSRCALKLRASSNRRPPTGDVEPAAAEPGLSDAERRDLWRVLDEEIRRLPAKYQAAVVLCYLEGKTYQEAAEQLGCPVGTLSARLTAAREQLRKRLTARGVTLAGAGVVAVLCEQAAQAGTAGALVEKAVPAVRGGPAALAAGKAFALAEEVAKTLSSLSKLRPRWSLWWSRASSASRGTACRAARATTSERTTRRPRPAPRAPRRGRSAPGSAAPPARPTTPASRRTAAPSSRSARTGCIKCGTPPTGSCAASPTAASATARRARCSANRSRPTAGCSPCAAPSRTPTNPAGAKPR